MKYVKLGRTNVTTSSIGFGGMRFTKEKDNCFDVSKCAELVKYAYSKGITYFDTAPSYCDNLSENIFGEAFKTFSGDFTVSTKSMAHSGIELRKELETSLKKMNLEKIDVFHIWCVKNLDEYKERMKENGPYAQALRAKEEGLIENLAISTHCSGEEVAQIVKDDKFDVITMGMNVLNYNYRVKGLEAALNNNIGVVVMNPLGGGLIPNNQDLFKEKLGMNEPILDSMKFLLGTKGINVLLCGFSNKEEIEYNLKVFKDNENDFTRYADKYNVLLSKEFNKLCTGCNYCMPCTVGLEIPKLMMGYNAKILEGQESAMGAFKYHWGISPSEAEKCIECGLCEEKCTQHLPIIERMRELSLW